MTYTKFIAINSLLIGAAVALPAILELPEAIYLISLFYSFSLLLNKKLSSKPLILCVTIALSWLIAMAAVLAYVKVRTCELGSEEWFCDVDGIFVLGFIYFGTIHTALIALAAYILKIAKRKRS